jgi:hypothetical protein
MATETQSLSLPTEAELNAAAQGAWDGLDDVVRIVVRVRKFVGHFDDPENGAGVSVAADDTPTHADIGALWSFAERLQDTAVHYNDHARTIKDRLRGLDDVRRFFREPRVRGDDG